MTISKLLGNSRMSPLDAELLLSHVLGKPREYLFTHPEKKLTRPQIVKFGRFAKKRLKGEPVAYLTGKKEFYGLEFAVNKDVLIPRPETELLVETAIKKISRCSGTPLRRWLNTKYPILYTLIDIGTGSGNIIISVVKNLPPGIRKKTEFYATDISEKALQMAKKNADRHKVAKRVRFAKSDLLAFSKKNKLSGNILIIANLPYVSPKLYRKHRQNLRYEPKKALISEKEGMAHYLKLIGEIQRLVESNPESHIACFMEISPEQKGSLAKAIQKELQSAKLAFARDLTGKWRMARLDVRSRNC